MYTVTSLFVVWEGKNRCRGVQEKIDAVESNITHVEQNKAYHQECSCGKFASLSPDELWKEKEQLREKELLLLRSANHLHLGTQKGA